MDSIQKTVDSNSDDLLKKYPDCLIINRPDLKTRPLVFGEQLLTIIFWGFWFYLWLPLISALAWLFGFHILYAHIVALGGFDGFLRQLNVFCSGIAVSSGILALWSFYNLKRYGTLNRRTKVYVTDQEALKKTFFLSSSQLNLMRQDQRITVSFTSKGSITEISTK